MIEFLFAFLMFICFASVFTSSYGLSPKELEQLYLDYAKSFGDCEAPKDVSAHHGFWELVGQHPATNSYCGTFQKFKGCLREDLHRNSNLDGASHVGGEAFVRKIHRWCNSPLCRVCCFSGWAKRLADHATQRIEVASKHYGMPQHIIVSPPPSDWGLFEFENEKFRLKYKKLLYSLGVVGDAG